MVDEWLQIVLGPLGALVLSATAAVLGLRELQKRYQAEIARLEMLLQQRDAAVDAARSALSQCQLQRISDAKETTEALIELNDKVHETLERVETLSGTCTRHESA